MLANDREPQDNQKTLTIAVVGNPNVGKTTLFNALTGLAHVTGNYPGVTVERKVGALQLNGTAADLVDLPGTYSLAARSPDEMIVVDVLLGQQAGECPVDAVLAVVDATNLERNLYLVSQVRELGKPLVIALNMIDLARKRGIAINVPRLAQELGAQVVPVCAYKREGIEELKRELLRATRGPAPAGAGPDYPPALVAEAGALETALNARDARRKLGREVPFLEVFRLLIDRDGYAEHRLEEHMNGDLRPLLDRHRERVTPNGSLAAIEARSRYAWIRNVVAAGVRRPATPVTTFSDRLDSVLTHRVFGTFIFAGIMATVFQAIFAWASPLMDGIDAVCGAMGERAGGLLPEGPLQSLVVDGVFGGVGSVLVFLPQILILMLFIALLEDCGYMARAAFLMDRLLSRCGLSGQSFIPMLSSFACAIPGIMATRTISNRRDRFTTILVAPLMSCSARLPVYTLLITAFIPETHYVGGLVGLRGLTLLSLYALGILVAVPVAWLLKKTLLRGDTPPFLLELPSYKLPQWRTVSRKVYVQGLEFVRRAGTIIFAIAVLVWALAYFPHSDAITQEYAAQRAAIESGPLTGEERVSALEELNRKENGEHLQNSLFGRMGHWVEPVVRPLGWDWRIGMAAIASFPAREVVIATLGTTFFLGSDVDESSDSLKQVLRAAQWPDGRPLFTVPVALSLIVFFALCCQCGATLAIIRRETQSFRWPLFTFAYMTLLAYLGAFLVYQATTLLGWGGPTA
ncbi:MAG: ferrous iron transport protein B [Candidatus Hydrogenedentes bacterium]|nr:ferrous iron transport protein B [Candidatus Hydrogenedentota bacterium]